MSDADATIEWLKRIDEKMERGFERVVQECKDNANNMVSNHETICAAKRKARGFKFITTLLITGTAGGGIFNGVLNGTI